MAPIANRPFLEWQLHSLADRGIDKFILALGHCSQMVIESIREPWAARFEIDTVIERDLLGTGGAILYAMDEFKLKEALVVNGDTFIAGSLKEMLIPLDFESGELMRLATVNVSNRSRFGGVAIDEMNWVTEFLEKGQTGAGQINAGLYRIHRLAFSEENQSAFSLETQIMPRMASNKALQAREIDGPFIDIGVPDDYRYFDANVYRFIRQVKEHFKSS